MFKDTEAFSGFSIKDVEATKHFYGELLGMDIQPAPGMEDYGILELRAGNGNKLTLYHKDDHQPATFTVLNFIVKDIDEAVAGLVAKGIAMIRYDGADMHQDDKGIMRGRSADAGPDIAWFSDPSGNILSVLQND